MITGSNHTYVGRYDCKEMNGPENDRYKNLNTVIADFSDRIRNVLSVGCSQGINEVIEAIQFPDKQFTGIDTNATAIERAVKGRWTFEDVSPYDNAFSSEKNLDLAKELFAQHCNPEYFEMDAQNGLVILKKPLPNTSFLRMNALSTGFPNESFNLIISHYFDGSIKNLTETQYSVGFEIERLLPNDGLFWNQYGCYVYKRSGLMGHFEQVKKDGSGKVTYESVDRSKLFPDPAQSDRPDLTLGGKKDIVEAIAHMIAKDILRNHSQD